MILEDFEARCKTVDEVLCDQLYTDRRLANSTQQIAVYNSIPQIVLYNSNEKVII